MVRLKGDKHQSPRHGFIFQFHYGTIKSNAEVPLSDYLG